MNRPPREIEAVFVTTPQVLRRLPTILRRVAPEVRGPTRWQVRDLYLDTTRWTLYRTGLACRLRLEPRRAILGIKSLTPLRRGLARRLEREEIIAGPTPTFPGPLPGRRIAAVLARQLAGEKLRVLFELRQRRTLYHVRHAQARFVVSLDRVFCGGRRRLPPLCKVEVELLHGGVPALRHLAGLLAQSAPLRPATCSKFEEGLRRSELRPPPRPARALGRRACRSTPRLPASPRR